MKRIFYNSKIKKLFISLSLVIMLFGYIAPLRIFAVINEDIDTVAQNWKELTDNSEIIEDYMAWNYSSVKKWTTDQYKKLITQIREEDNRNTVVSEKKNEKIYVYISVTSLQSVEKYMVNGAGGDGKVYYSLGIGDNGLEDDVIKDLATAGLIIKIIDTNLIPEGEEDTRTEEQKVIDKLVSEFGVDPEVAPGMLEPDENR